MGHSDSQTVPVVVTVQHAVHPNPAPRESLPFTGAPVESLTAVGLVLAATGAVIVTAVRRRTSSP